MDLLVLLFLGGAIALAVKPDLLASFGIGSGSSRLYQAGTGRCPRPYDPSPNSATNPPWEATCVAARWLSQRLGVPPEQMVIWYQGIRQRQTVAAFHDCRWVDPDACSGPNPCPAIGVNHPGWVTGVQVSLRVGDATHDVLVDPNGQIGCWNGQSV